jgi:hypothetical protein
MRGLRTILEIVSNMAIIVVCVLFFWKTLGHRTIASNLLHAGGGGGLFPTCAATDGPADPRLLF